jgi:hypothetical protein
LFPEKGSALEMLFNGSSYDDCATPLACATESPDLQRLSEYEVPGRSGSGGCVRHGVGNSGRPTGCGSTSGKIAALVPECFHASP